MTELNHHNDATGLMMSLHASTGPKPDLGNMETVEKIVRQFVFDITHRFELVGMGATSPTDAAAQDRAECERMGKIFTGQDPEYRLMPGWNDGPLAAFVRERMGESINTDEPDDQVVAQAFALLVHSTYATIRSLDGSGGADATERLGDHIKSTVWLLVGLQSDE